MGNLISGEVIFKEKAVITLENCRKAYGWNCSLCTGLACKVSAYHPWPSGLGILLKACKTDGYLLTSDPRARPKIIFHVYTAELKGNQEHVRNFTSSQEVFTKYCSAVSTCTLALPFTTHMERGRKKPPRNVNCKHRVWCPQSFASGWTSPFLQGWISQCTH